MSISFLAGAVKQKHSYFAADFSTEVSSIKTEVRQSVEKSEETLLDFGRRIFAAISENSVAVKLNFFDFIMLPKGMNVLAEAIHSAKSCGLYVILGAEGIKGELLPILFGEKTPSYTFEPDALEICPYCADKNKICELAKAYSRDIFITLNTDAGYSPAVYAEHIKKFASPERTGFLISESNSEELCDLRENLHEYMFAASGKDIDEEIKNCFNPDGSGAIVLMPVSRFIRSAEHFEREAALGTMKSAAAINRRLFKKSRILKL